MSELQFHLSRPRPAIEPIETRGNAFWREDCRFFIKGIYYAPRDHTNLDVPRYSRPQIDALADDHLDELRRDIYFIRELGLNCVRVSQLDPNKSHHEALVALAKAGLYVVVSLLDGVEPPKPEPETHWDAQQAYSLDVMLQTFKLINELANHPNILGFAVNTRSSNGRNNTCMAEVLRANIRDIKRFLRLRPHGRQIPVGVVNHERLLQRTPALRYFTAGTTAEEKAARVDFFAPESWGWAYQSSFLISGWQNMVKQFDPCPVPMFLHAFGSYVGKPRIWDEVECLFSPDMTGVFSGGFAYEYFDRESNYGVMKGHERKKRNRKRGEFKALKAKFRTVHSRKSDQIHEAKVKVYEDWVGEFPEAAASEGQWKATANLPEFPGDWEQLGREYQLREETIHRSVEG